MFARLNVTFVSGSFVDRYMYKTYNVFIFIFFIRTSFMIIYYKKTNTEIIGVIWLQMTLVLYQ